MKNLEHENPKNSAWVGSLVVFVGLPLGLSIAYLFFFAANVYEAESQFIVKQNQQDTAPSGFELGSLFSTSSTSGEDAFLISKFIHSSDLLKVLEEEIGLRDHYSSPRMDYIRRLNPDGSKEDFLEYYRGMVSIVIEESNIVSLNVKAFDPETALQVLNFILEKSEDFINRISKMLADEQVNFVREELTRAEANFRKAKDGILAFQNRKTLVDPERDIKSKIEILSEMEAEITQKKAALKELKGFLQGDTFEVSKLENQIRALENQISEEMRELTGSPDISLNQVMSEFHNLSLDLEFAENAYKSAIASLEASRLEASRKLKHMVIISSTELPEEPCSPRKIYGSATSFVVLLLLFGIGKLVVATINDHRE